MSSLVILRFIGNKQDQVEVEMWFVCFVDLNRDISNASDVLFKTKFRWNGTG